MKISFVTPTYNRAPIVGRTIDSVLALVAQGVDCEVIVINDASTDDFAGALAPYRGHDAVRVIEFTENRGQNAGRNAGFAAARGEIVSLIDSDDEVLQADYDVIRRAFDDPRIIGVFTQTVSGTTGRSMCDLTRAGTIFDYRGFLDGTYEGEYHMFLRKSALPEKPFEENLGIKRSCTLLTWLRLGQLGSFVILPLKTRLYDDTGLDRMGNIDNILNDAAEIDTCTSLVISRNADLIRQASPSALRRLVVQRSYYRLLSRGRAAALASLREAPLALAGWRELLAICGAIVAGPAMVRRLRRLRG